MEGAADELIEIAKSRDQDPGIRRQAVESLGHRASEKRVASLDYLIGARPQPPQPTQPPQPEQPNGGGRSSRLRPDAAPRRIDG